MQSFTLYSCTWNAIVHVILMYLKSNRSLYTHVLEIQSFTLYSCTWNLIGSIYTVSGARTHTLLPLIIDRNVNLPRILQHLAVCDFFNSSITEWVWNRLIKALMSKDKHPDTSSRDSEDITELTESLRELQLPRYRRLSSNKEDTVATKAQWRQSTVNITSSFWVDRVKWTNKQWRHQRK